MDILTKIGFGCVGLTVQPSLKKALNLLEYTFDQGIKLFDTAPVYGQGYSEVILGKFLKNKREQITITTKFGLGNIKEPPIPAILALPLHQFKKKLYKADNLTLVNNYIKIQKRVISLKQVQFDFESSLKRLQTDYIDNYLLHEGAPDFLTPAALDYIFELKEKGLVKKIGVGICHKNLEDISSEELINWDILQYENNYQLNTGAIYSKFPEKEHIHHTVLKNVKNGQNAGHLMAQHLLNFPKAKILFSSSKCENISQNLKDMTDLYKKLIF